MAVAIRNERDTQQRQADAAADAVAPGGGPGLLVGLRRHVLHLRAQERTAGAARQLVMQPRQPGQHVRAARRALQERAHAVQRC